MEQFIGSENPSSAEFSDISSPEATIGDLSINNENIVSQTGAISFENNDLTTTGSINAGGQERQ